MFSRVCIAACIYGLLGCGIVCGEENPVARFVHPHYGLSVNAIRQDMPGQIKDRWDVVALGRLQGSVVTALTLVSLRPPYPIDNVMRDTRLQFVGERDRLFQIERRKLGSNQAVFMDFEDHFGTQPTRVAALEIHRQNYNLHIAISWPRDEFERHAELSRAILRDVQLNGKSDKSLRDYPAYRDDRLGLRLRCPDYRIDQAGASRVGAVFRFVDSPGVAAVYLRKGKLPNADEEIRKVNAGWDKVESDISKTRLFFACYAAEDNSNAMMLEHQASGDFSTRTLVAMPKKNAKATFAAFRAGIELKRSHR